MTRNTKGLIGLFCGALLLLSLGLFLCWDRPPFQSAHRAITIGMTRQQVEQLVPPRPELDPDARQGIVLAVEWEGIRGSGRAFWPKLGSPPDSELRGSILYDEPQRSYSRVPGGEITVSEEGTGKLLAVGCMWGTLEDHLEVYYDPETWRVIEKRHQTYQVHSGWRQRIRNWIGF